MIFKKRAILSTLAVCAITSVAYAALTTVAEKTPGRWLVQFKAQNMTHFGLKNTHTLVLTYDDGPGDGTVRITKLLEDNGLHATFFLIGANLNDHKDLAQKEMADGNTVGNHSYTHPDLSSGAYQGVGNKKLIYQLQETNGVLKNALGKEWIDQPVHFFRAPYGSWTPSDARTANAINSLKPEHYLGPIFWDIGGEINCDGKADSADASFCDGKPLTDAADWDCWDRGYTIERCEEGYWAKIHELGGGVILSHDLYANSATMWEDMLPKILAEKDADGKPLWKIVLLKDSRAIEQYVKHANYPDPQPEPKKK